MCVCLFHGGLSEPFFSPPNMDFGGAWTMVEKLAYRRHDAGLFSPLLLEDPHDRDTNS